MKILLLIIALAIFNVDSKVIHKTMGSSLIQGGIWHPITKFTMGRGKGYYTMNIWNPAKNVDTKEISVTLLLFTYDTWKLQQKMPTCYEKQQLSVYQQKANIRLDGTEFSFGNNSLGQTSLIQVWYFVLANCEDSQDQEILQQHPLMYNLTIINSDGSQISEEENGVMTVLILALIPIFIFFIFNSVKLIQFSTNQVALDYPLLMLVFVLVLESLGLSSELLHLYLYSLSGKGNFFFDWISFIFSNLSQLLISFLFLLMASGWTTKTLTERDEQNFAILGTVTSILSLLMAITGKISTTDIDSFHDYENLFGILTLLIKFALYLVFARQLWKNYERNDPKLKLHYLKLGVFGSIYLLSFPIIVIAADLFLPPYFRHKTTTYATIIIQSSALLIYAFILSVKENEYYPIVYKNQNLLPLNKVI